MRVTFKMEGGVAHFPGFARPVEIDTEDLPPDEARELEERVRAARLFEPGNDRDTANGKVPGAMRDGRHYTVAVENGGDRKTAEVRDPIEDPCVSALITLLARHQRRILAAGRP